MERVFYVRRTVVFSGQVNIDLPDGADIDEAQHRNLILEALPFDWNEADVQGGEIKEIKIDKK